MNKKVKSATAGSERSKTLETDLIGEEMGQKQAM